MKKIEEDLLQDKQHKKLSQDQICSRDFNKYLERVIENENDIEIKTILYENLKEEIGDELSNDFRKWSHRKIFNQICNELNVNSETYRFNNEVFFTVKLWRDMMLKNCASKLPGVSFGTISFGTELIVPTIYRKILSALNSKKGKILSPLFTISISG